MPCNALKLCITRWEATDIVSGFAAARGTIPVADFSFLASCEALLDWFSTRAVAGSITVDWFSTRDIDCAADRFSVCGVDLSPRAVVVAVDDWPFDWFAVDLSVDRRIVGVDLSVASTVVDWLLLADSARLPFSTGDVGAGNGAVCERCFLVGIWGLLGELRSPPPVAAFELWSWTSGESASSGTVSRTGKLDLKPLADNDSSRVTFELLELLSCPFALPMDLVSSGFESIFKGNLAETGFPLVPFFSTARLGSPLGKLANLAIVCRSSATWGANGIFLSVGLMDCLFLAVDAFVLCLCLFDSFLAIGRVSGKCLPFMELGSSSSSS